MTTSSPIKLLDYLIMKKQELVEVFKDLHPEDTSGEITGEVYLDDGTMIQTDSIRVDMDGGRIILASKKSNMYAINKKNWIQELIFYKNKKLKSA